MKRSFCISLIVMAVVFFLLPIQQAYGASKRIPIPEFYGIYLISKGKLIELPDAREEERLKVIGNMASSVKGIKSLSGVDVLDEKVYFIVYLKNISPADVELVKLTYQRKMILGGDNAFINPAKEYDADMWTNESSIKLKFAPIKGKEDMLRVVPAKPLSKGLYALGIGGAWRSQGGFIGNQTRGTAADFGVNCKKCEISEKIEVLLASGEFLQIMKWGGEAKEPLVAVLSHKDLLVRRRAALMLGNLGDKRALKPLIDLFKNDKDDFGFQQARSILRKAFNNKRTVHLLASILQDGSPLARVRAILGLEALATDGRNLHAVGPIVASLKDPSKDVQIVASRALGNIGDSVAVEPLITVLKDKEENVREAAAKALGKLGDKRAIEPLKVLLNDSSDAARSGAVQGLLSLEENIEPRGLTVVSKDDILTMGEWALFGTNDPLSDLIRGKRVKIGKGQCPLCHKFFQEQKAGRGPSVVS